MYICQPFIDHSGLDWAEIDTKEMMRDSGTIEIIGAILDYCINAYDPMNLKEELPFRLMQGPEHEAGGGAWSGFSVALESAYVEENLNNPLKGLNAAELIAHEIISISGGAFSLPFLWGTGALNIPILLMIRRRNGPRRG